MAQPGEFARHGAPGRRLLPLLVYISQNLSHQMSLYPFRLEFLPQAMRPHRLFLETAPCPGVREPSIVQVPLLTQTVESDLRVGLGDPPGRQEPRQLSPRSVPSGQQDCGRPVGGARRVPPHSRLRPRGFSCCSAIQGCSPALSTPRTLRAKSLGLLLHRSASS